MSSIQIKEAERKGLKIYTNCPMCSNEIEVKRIGSCEFKGYCNKCDAWFGFEVK